MRITPLVIAKRNLIEAYYNRSVIYSVFFPVIFLLVYIMQNSTTKLAVSTQVPGTIIGLAFVLGSLDDALLSISRERDEGTLTKLFLSPVSRWSIIGGRILSSFILGIFKATLVFLLALTNFLEMDHTGLNLYIGLASFYALSSLTILLTVLLGLICSALFRAFKITVLLASSVILLFALPPAITAINSFYQGNPFWMCYNVFDHIVKAQYLSITIVLQILIWVVALFLIAGVSLRRKIA